MSHFERNLKYLNRHKVVYRRDPITDKPTEVFSWGVFFENGTRECYTLFQSRAKITTYKSLKWHLYVLWYLNPQMGQDDFTALTEYITQKKNGFITFKITEGLMQSMVYDVCLMDLERPPPNKIRKVIFKDGCRLEIPEKLSIVGSLIGRKKLSESEIYEAMLMLHDDGNKITANNISRALGCSLRTVYRNMGNELKREKVLLNQQL